MRKISIASVFFVLVLSMFVVLSTNIFAVGDEVAINVILINPTEVTSGSNHSGTLGGFLQIDPSGLLGEDEEFAYFVHNGQMIKNENQQFLISPSTYVVVVTKKIDDIAVTYIDSNGNYLGHKFSNLGEFEPGALVSVTPSKPGYSFDGWYDPGMVTEDTIIKPIYSRSNENLLTVEILNSTGTGFGEFNYNDLVTVSATSLDFSHWVHKVDENTSKIISYDKDFTFTLLQDVTLEAMSDSLVSREPLMYLQKLSTIRAGYDSYLGQVNLPSGYTIVEKGLLVSNSNTSPKLSDVDGLTVEKIVSKTVHPITNEFLISLTVEEYANVRAYLLYADDLGVLQPAVFSFVEEAQSEPVMTYEFDFTDESDVAKNLSRVLMETVVTNAISSTPFTFRREYTLIDGRANKPILRGIILDIEKDTKDVSPYVHTDFAINGLKKIEISIGNWGIYSDQRLDSVAESINLETSIDGVNWNVVKDMKPGWNKKSDYLNEFTVNVPNASNEALYVRIILNGKPDVIYSGPFKLIITNIKFFS